MNRNNHRDDDIRRLFAELPEPAPADEALRRHVLAVPECYPQYMSLLEHLRAQLPELGRWLSAPALAAQAGMLVIAAAAGVWVGLNAGTAQVDLSDWTLVLAPDDYEEELL